MSEDTAFKAVDAIFRSAIKQHFRKVKIKYAGGEASLEIKRVSAIHDYAAQLASEFHLDFEAVLLSNGVVLSQRSIDLLKARAIEIMISLDGIGSFNDVQRPFRNGTGSFYYVKRTIARLQANDIYPNIAVTVSQRNLSGLVELIEYILDRKLPFTLNYYREHEHSSQLDGLSFTETHMIATMRTVFSVIVQRLPRQKLLGSLLDKTNAGIPHRHTCGVGRNYFVIDQHGGISKCHANIKHTVTSVHTNDPLLDIQKDASGIQNIPVEQKEGCQTCEWRYWCAGGCPLLTYKVTGRNDIRSPNCNIYKALFPEVLRMEALRLLQYQSSVVIE